MGISFRNFTLPLNEAIILIVFAIIGGTYYFFFGGHHKRNNMTFAEIYPLVINYYILAIISSLVLFFGIDTVITGYVYNDEIAEVLKELFVGFTIIILVVLNFIFYIKKHRIDLNQEIREAEEQRTNYIAEWIEIIIFALMIIFAIFNIIKYANFIDKMQKYKQIANSVLCIIISVFLTYNLNPLNIKDKIKSCFRK